ncbi:MAG: alpha/beta fold hydrolase [Alphaproteobacteria bacterium]|nr:alpha/beta fold hydrolase [Alphaproteobacteria bacterium]MBU2085289.1 alpha/beta fold hydrolase [Alphaproteobacteria bacterium]MBU2142609.1 alpha/beta fold hydrolase [Alphaproteobacteria bacterium]MBU2196222.1 alpha/beta fold hydrolase [Alphaproteobacteria bacterium]
MPIEAKRTPDDRFDNLPGYQFAPNYLDTLRGYEGLRVHYVDEGPKDAVRTYLCLHGEPSWAYLYRKMIPVFLDSGARVIAPDWLGFGRSDKPVDDAVYTFSFHRDMMIALIERLNLKNVTLVCQDWGGLLGLTIPMDMPQRFERLIVMNTAIATGQSPSEGFDNWKAYMRTQPDVDVAALMKRGTPVLSDAEAAAYGAPFPDASYKAGVRRFPELVMTAPGMDGIDISKRATAWWANKWSGDSFMAIGAQDPVLGTGPMGQLQKTIRGCPPPMIVADAGHFVQEWGEPVARAALKHFGEL